MPRAVRLTKRDIKMLLGAVDYLLDEVEWMGCPGLDTRVKLYCGNVYRLGRLNFHTGEEKIRLAKDFLLPLVEEAARKRSEELAKMVPVMYKFAFEHETGDHGYYVDAPTVDKAEAKFRTLCDEKNKKMAEEYGAIYPVVCFDDFMIVRIYETNPEAGWGEMIWDIHDCEPFPCYVVCP